MSCPNLLTVEELEWARDCIDDALSLLRSAYKRLSKDSEARFILTTSIEDLKDIRADIKDAISFLK